MIAVLVLVVVIDENLSFCVICQEMRPARLTMWPSSMPGRQVGGVAERRRIGVEIAVGDRLFAPQWRNVK